ncbi:hypothetical protein M9979_10835 [Sphingomonas sp. RP10(2022)]|uniref:Uncharacterized protein n=1 Tax=Sphingomonas liriopis TaxID=2949094 RepID=A0A9X2HXS8_9SPHN|nr:hypothetical protein [Sphingomonas liriopis]MCP3735364.1 hypothetical protein [Sphingomonas liriopis]
MIYPFKSKMMQGFKKLEMPQQLGAMVDNYWNKELPEILTGAQQAQPFLEDLNGFLDAAETKVDADAFKAIAASCAQMVAATNTEWLKTLYALSPDAVGTVLMRCMRVINRQTHNAGALKAFKTLFDALGIKIVGPWDTCVGVASFGSTSFHDGTLEVTLP